MEGVDQVDEEGGPVVGDGEFPVFGDEVVDPVTGVAEDEVAEVIRVTPLMVIKTKNGVVCGALQKRLKDA